MRNKLLGVRQLHVRRYGREYQNGRNLQHLEKNEPTGVDRVLIRPRVRFELK